jgi:hypothetical protein
MKVAKTALDTLCGRGQRAVISSILYATDRLVYFFNEWVLTTNHRKLAILYFGFVVLTGFVGLILATIIRIELAYPGQAILTQNAERYLTLISVHGIVMVFFVVIPLIFGAFGNFLLPTQLGVRDVAFPRLNSFMFWVTPSGFVLLLHILLFDRSYTVTHWLNYGEARAHLRRRYQSPQPMPTRFSSPAADTVLAWRLANPTADLAETRATVLRASAPALDTTLVGDPTLAGQVVGRAFTGVSSYLVVWLSSLLHSPVTGFLTHAAAAVVAVTPSPLSLAGAGQLLAYGDLCVLAQAGSSLLTPGSLLANLLAPRAFGGCSFTPSVGWGQVGFSFLASPAFTPTQPFCGFFFAVFDSLVGALDLVGGVFNPLVISALAQLTSLAFVMCFPFTHQESLFFSPLSWAACLYSFFSPIPLLAVIDGLRPHFTNVVVFADGAAASVFLGPLDCSFVLFYSLILSSATSLFQLVLSVVSLPVHTPVFSGGFCAYFSAAYRAIRGLFPGSSYYTDTYF